ncbi:MAG: pantoate--beta-alanine ligase [Phycisphaerales bacterium]|nr:pantoate--beta-alanine ligase [Phycisphaerales bacterium]
MQILSDISSLASYKGCTLVPTMGAIHEGHRSLVRIAAAFDEPVVVSIFVNPKQFAPGEDLATYPRSLDRDLEMIAADGASAALVPPEDLMYPPDEPVWSPPLPSVASNPKLEDLHRPHFFSGVCTVVARLFDLIQPSTAILGEKDWQQLQVIRSMVQMNADRWPAIHIKSGPTIRESDGLAMSSRNAFLDPANRERAIALSSALAEAIKLPPVEAELTMQDKLFSADLDIDYAVVRDAQTLQAPQKGQPQRALIAATLNGTRLIDNAAML